MGFVIDRNFNFGRDTFDNIISEDIKEEVITNILEWILNMLELDLIRKSMRMVT